jgi:3'(2'), 5'-bisphosphate nucleotidase
MSDALFSLTGAAPLLALAREAGDAILSVYNSPESVAITTKADDSPLTQADLAAHQCIWAGLRAIADLPMISEESPLPPVEVRRQWQNYWMIDPLDGTKEFLHRNGEFTVNIALIEAGRPVLGVVHLPVPGISYLGINSPESARECWKLTAAGDARQLRVQPPDRQQPLRCLGSHRHSSAEQTQLLENLAQLWPAGIQSMAAGSSLKLCWLAEGLADIYPRLGPTSEWDTAAAQAVLEAAGGAVIDGEELDQGRFAPLSYNQRESVLNPWFYALADTSVDWLQLLQSARNL